MHFVGLRGIYCSVLRQNASAFNFRSSRYYFLSLEVFFAQLCSVSCVHSSSIVSCQQIWPDAWQQWLYRQKDHPLAKKLFWVLIVKRELNCSSPMNKFRLYLPVLLRKKKAEKNHNWNNEVGICTKTLKENIVYKKKKKEYNFSQIKSALKNRVFIGALRNSLHWCCSSCLTPNMNFPIVLGVLRKSAGGWWS